MMKSEHKTTFVEVLEFLGDRPSHAVAIGERFWPDKAAAVISGELFMTEFIVTRLDSMADTNGKGRHKAICFGTLSADDARQAMELSHQKFSCNGYQWFEVENVKYAKPARVNAARRCNVEAVA